VTKPVTARRTSSAGEKPPSCPSGCRSIWAIPFWFNRAGRKCRQTRASKTPAMSRRTRPPSRYNTVRLRPAPAHAGSNSGRSHHDNLPKASSFCRALPWFLAGLHRRKPKTTARQSAPASIRAIASRRPFLHTRCDAPFTNSRGCPRALHPTPRWAAPIVLQSIFNAAPSRFHAIKDSRHRPPRLPHIIPLIHRIRRKLAH